MIEWLTADAGAANWAVLALNVVWGMGLCLALACIGALQCERDDLKHDLLWALADDRMIRARLARARAALDGKDESA